MLLLPLAHRGATAFICCGIMFSSATNQTNFRSRCLHEGISTSITILHQLSVVAKSMEGRVSLRPFSFLSELHPPCHGRGLSIAFQPSLYISWHKTTGIPKTGPLSGQNLATKENPRSKEKTHWFWDGFAVCFQFFGTSGSEVET